MYPLENDASVSVGKNSYAPPFVYLTESVGNIPAAHIVCAGFNLSEDTDKFKPPSLDLPEQEYTLTKQILQTIATNNIRITPADDFLRAINNAIIGHLFLIRLMRMTL